MSATETQHRASPPPRTRVGGRWLFVLTVVACMWDASARAQEFEAKAAVLEPVPATNAEDATASGSTIAARGRGRALEDVAEAVEDVPGLRVQDAGGVGAFSGVALRGAEVGHTAVLLGSIPLNTPDSGAFDLGVLPLAALDRVEVYRGGAPTWYSEGAIGGLVRFVPATAEDGHAQATAGLGSFGRRELRGTTSVMAPRGRRPAFFGHVRMLSSDNDYPYLDDGQTRFDSSDDRELRQQNAEFLSGDGLAHGGVDALGGRVTVLAAGHGRLQGIPGPLAAPTRQVRRKLVRSLAGVGYEREAFDTHGDRRYRVELSASGTHQRDSLTDLALELGRSTAVDSDDVWRRGHVRAAAGVGVLPFLEPTLVLSLATDAYRPSNPAAFTMPPRPSDRATEALAFEPRLHGRLFGMRAELRPSVRAAWSQTSIRADTSLEQIDLSEDLFTPTYRIGAAIEPLTALSIAASLATGTRAPSILELFGDRVYQEPNARLKPERSTMADVSAVLRGRVGLLTGALEARGFMLSIDDLIRYERTSQFTVRPDNTAEGTLMGLELGTMADLGRHLSLTGAITAMRTENQFGRELPMRPPLQLLLRPEVHALGGGREDLTLFFETHHISFVYLDEVNISSLPARTLFAFGGAVTLYDERVGLQLRVNNVFDQRATDVLSRPLPGRDFRFAITVREELP